jgi:hypothetical protein
MKTTDSFTLEFLGWVSSRPRTYAEAMQAWRSTCPRRSIWPEGGSGCWLGWSDEVRGKRVSVPQSLTCFRCVWFLF